MKIDEKPLPNFVKNITKKELKASEDLIMLIYNKLILITKATQTQNFIKPKILPKVVTIVSKTATLAFDIKEILKEQENKIKLNVYLKMIEKIVSDLEINVIANSVNFFNIKLLKHYQKVVNIVLIETKIMDVINFCIKKLHDESENNEK